jgi:EmrB/QacA subfamily drug resistance transporter
MLRTAETATPEPRGESLAEAIISPSHPEPPAARSGPLLPMIIGTALFMQTLDSTVISNALPTMARALHEDPVTLNLAITAYLLAAAVFLPISAWVADRFGAKRVFRAAIIGFALSSLLCGLAQNLPMLVVARLLQGMAGAMMVPVGRLVLLRSVPKSEIVQALSWLTMPALLGPVLGPPIGGFIVTFFSWRWIFFINVPMGLLGVILVSKFIPDIREEGVQHLDVLGFVLTGLGLAGLVYGFDNLGRDALPAWAVAGMLIAGVACCVAYAWHARRIAHPILDLSLLRNRPFAASTIGGLFSRLNIGASPFLLALLLQLGFGMSAFSAGLLTFTAAVGALLMKTTARPIIHRFGFKPVLVANAWIVAVTSAAYSLFHIDTPHWLMIIVLLVSGFFRSLQFTALNAMGYAEVTPPQMSRASSLATMFQQLAQSLGVGLAAVLIHYTMLYRHSATLTAADVSPAFAIVSAISLVALVFYMRLPADAGAEAAGRLNMRLEPDEG